MVKKEVLFLISAAFIILFSLNFVFSAHTTSPAAFTLNQSQPLYTNYYKFNITFNNTNNGQDGNITQVDITLPDGFSFITGSNGQSINHTAGYSSDTATFTNTSNILTWTNNTLHLINGSVNKSYFWFNVSVPSILGNYNITITSYNSSNQSYRASTNLTITVNDITPPGVTLDYPADGGNYSLSSINFNITVADNTNGIGLFACNYTKDGGVINYTMSNATATASAFNATNSSIANGIYNATFYCFDLSGNVNKTTTTTFRLDTLAPFINMDSPTNNLNISLRRIQVNITANDSHGTTVGTGVNYATISAYLSGVLVNTTADIVVRNVTNSSNSITVPQDGNYTINVTSYDFLGQQNSTTINVIVDTLAPTLTVVSPINNTTHYANQSILVYLARTDTTAGTIWYNYNETGSQAMNTNYSMGVINLGSANIHFNSTGIKNISFFANDTFSNITRINYILTITALPATEFIANDTTFTPNSTQTNLVVPYNTTLQNITLSNESQKFSLDLSQVMISNAVTLGANPFTLITTGTTYNYTAYIPASTTITGPAGWDGKINLPTVNTSAFSAPAISNYTTSTNVVIDMGSSSRLNFSSPVKITIGGMKGKRAAWSLAGNSTLNDISTVCTNISDGTGIVAGSACYGDSGNDLVIWTYHFTTFAAYTPTLITVAESTGSGSTITQYWTSTQAITPQQLTAGYTKALAVKNRLSFLVGSSTHYAGIVALTSTQATINVSSIPQKKTLSAGDEWKVEVSGDNSYDVLVKLNSIANNKANITIKSINEPIAAPPVTPPAAPPATAVEKIKEIVKEPSKFLSSRTFWIIVLVVIVIIVVLVLLLKNKKKYYHKGY